MLGQDWQFIVHNKCGQSLDFSTNSANETLEITYRRFHAESSGLVHESSEQSASLTSDVADDTAASFGAVTGDNEMGMKGTVELTTDNASAAGDVYFWIEFSTDGGTTYPSDAANFDPNEDLNAGAGGFLGAITLAGAETKNINFEV